MKWTVAGPGQAPVPSGAASGTVSVAVGGLPGGSQERLKTVLAWVPGWAGSRGRVVAGRLGRVGDRPETDAVFGSLAGWVALVLKRYLHVSTRLGRLGPAASKHFE